MYNSALESNPDAPKNIAGVQESKEGVVRHFNVCLVFQDLIYKILISRQKDSIPVLKVLSGAGVVVKGAFVWTLNIVERDGWLNGDELHAGAPVITRTVIPRNGSVC